MIPAMQNHNHDSSFLQIKAYIWNRYIRQAVAWQKLGDHGKAKQCLERGLRVPALRNNKRLTEKLKEVENQT